MEFHLKYINTIKILMKVMETQDFWEPQWIRCQMIQVTWHLQKFLLQWPYNLLLTYLQKKRVFLLWIWVVLDLLDALDAKATSTLFLNSLKMGKWLLVIYAKWTIRFLYKQIHKFIFYILKNKVPVEY